MPVVLVNIEGLDREWLQYGPGFLSQSSWLRASHAVDKEYDVTELLRFVIFCGWQMEPS